MSSAQILICMIDTYCFIKESHRDKSEGGNVICTSAFSGDAVIGKPVWGDICIGWEDSQHQVKTYGDTTSDSFGQLDVTEFYKETDYETPRCRVCIYIYIYIYINMHFYHSAILRWCRQLTPPPPPPTHTHTNTHTDKRTQTNAHRLTRTHTDTHTHRHTQTHPYTHTRLSTSWKDPVILYNQCMVLTLAQGILRFHKQKGWWEYANKVLWPGVVKWWVIKHTS